MLQKLQIQNYALISELDIDFGEGLSIITGETGAGKSIMLGALGLLLGERAETKAVAFKDRKTMVEATFLTPQEVIVRREITPSGRSRAFIDDSPVTLQELRERTSGLLDIHSQHANLKLTTRQGQLQIIDAMAGNAGLLADYRIKFKAYISLRHKLKEAKEASECNEERRRMLEYQLAELDRLNPKEGELEEVEQRFEMLSDADEIRERLSSAHYNLDSQAESSALNKIRMAMAELGELNLEAIERAMPGDETLSQRLKDVFVELQDISDSIESLGAGIESNPTLLASTGARMRDLIEATRKFNVVSADDLIGLRKSMREELGGMIDAGDEIKALEKETRSLAKGLKESADVLSESRERGAREFADKLTRKAIPLGLPNLKFEVAISKGKLTPDGQDIPEFMCSFNKNGSMLPMSTTASGGELSRLTLSIKNLMAEKMEMPTVIFDEIDTGVSGEIADKMGQMMKEMSENAQIITITHLPQVAAKGKRHYKVYKKDTEARTETSIRELRGEERINEIAGMLSGEKLSEAAVNAAKALLDNA